MKRIFKKGDKIIVIEPYKKQMAKPDDRDEFLKSLGFVEVQEEK